MGGRVRAPVRLGNGHHLCPHLFQAVQGVFPFLSLSFAICKVARIRTVSAALTVGVSDP